MQGNRINNLNVLQDFMSTIGDNSDVDNKIKKIKSPKTNFFKKLSPLLK